MIQFLIVFLVYVWVSKRYFLLNVTNFIMCLSIYIWQYFKSPSKILMEDLHQLSIDIPLSTQQIKSFSYYRRKRLLMLSPLFLSHVHLYYNATNRSIFLHTLLEIFFIYLITRRGTPLSYTSKISLPLYYRRKFKFGYHKKKTVYEPERLARERYQKQMENYEQLQKDKKQTNDSERPQYLIWLLNLQ